MRPKYVAIRKRNTSKAILWILWATVFSSLDEEEERKRRERRSQRRRSSFLNRIVHARMQRLSNHNNHLETRSPTRHDVSQDEESQHLPETGRDVDKDEETREECSGYDIENGNDDVNQDFEVELSTNHQESKELQKDSNRCYKIDESIQVDMKDVDRSSPVLDVLDSNDVQDMPVDVHHSVGSRDNVDLSVRALLDVKDIVDEKLLKNNIDIE